MRVTDGMSIHHDMHCTDEHDNAIDDRKKTQ